MLKVGLFERPEWASTDDNPVVALMMCLLVFSLIAGVYPPLDDTDGNTARNAFMGFWGVYCLYKAAFGDLKDAAKRRPGVS